MSPTTPTPTPASAPTTAPAPGRIRTVCLQIDCPDGESVADRVRRVLADLRSTDADLVVLPELWATGYFRFDAYQAQAEPLTGPTLTAL
ncbi:nitrilase-related carbon-nitrogen hydrolase, partial [Frankia sp. AvcI1]